jgi:hypothetical protein
MLNFLAPLLIAIVLLAAISAFLFRHSNLKTARALGSHSRISYEAVPALLSPAERSFFGVLQQAVSSDYLIFAKVRLADIVRPIQSPSRNGWQSAFNRITGKHVDFILCDSLHLEVLAVIELDDKTHQRFDRGTRDGLVDSCVSNLSSINIRRTGCAVPLRVAVVVLGSAAGNVMTLGRHWSTSSSWCLSKPSLRCPPK